MFTYLLGYVVTLCLLWALVGAGQAAATLGYADGGKASDLPVQFGAAGVLALLWPVWLLLGILLVLALCMFSVGHVLAWWTLLRWDAFHDDA
jgi:hypothetical protein